MPDETLQSLRQKLNETLQNAVEQSPEYQGFLQAIADAEDAITQMNKTDNYGRIPIVDGAKRLELMRLYREIGMKAENVFRSDADKTRRELVKKITALAAGNHRALNSFDPEKERKTLPALLSRVRTLTLDARGAALQSTIGNQSNQRQPITFLDDKGRQISGVFTPKTVMNVRGSIQQKIEQIKSRVRNPAGRQILDSFMKKVCEWGAKQKNMDIRTWSEDQKPAMLDPFLQWVGSGPTLSQLNRERMRDAMNEIFADELQGADICSKIPKKLLWELGQTVCNQSININVNMLSGKIPDNARLDSRNAAMSAMAELLGVPKLLARSVPMKLITPDGRELEGTFMAEARGLDSKNLSDEAVGIDKNAVLGSTEDERAAIGKGFKDLADLQILDYLCGNVDRNYGNMLYQFTERKKFCGVQGIDNDCSLGLTMPAEDQAEKEMAALDNMRVISSSMEKAVSNLTPESLRFCLRGFDLSEAELDAAAHRLETLKNKLQLDKQIRVQGNELVEGSFRVIEDDQWSRLSMKKLSKIVHVPNPADPTQQDAIAGNIFATASSSIYEMSNDYARQQNAYRSLKSEIAIGADNRANRGGLHKTGAKTLKLLNLLQSRTTQGRSSPQYDAMLDAVEKYSDFQVELAERMRSADAHPQDPDAAFESIVSNTDLEELRLLSKAVKDTAQAYLNHKGGGLHFGYTARRIEAAKLALALGTKGAELSQAEEDTVVQNEKEAAVELSQRAGDQMEAAEKAGLKRPWGADDFEPAPVPTIPANPQPAAPQLN